MRYSNLIASFAFLALLGSGVGESSGPLLSVAELPGDVAMDCATYTANEQAAQCLDDSYQISWLARTPTGHLFLVEHGQCRGMGCRSWLVEKDGNQARTLLSLVGEYRLERVGAYPVVETRATAGGDASLSYNRYVWSGSRYLRTDTRTVYRVDGVECVDEQACNAAAQQALENNNTERAVKIWQQVHNVDWI